MPAERSDTSDPGRLSVGFDATPLLGRPTGIGAFCAGALGALAERGDVDVSAFAVSWRRRRWIEGVVPEGVATGQRAMPARPLHRAWGRSRLPPVEWFIGRRDVVHGPNFVVPPTRRAARVLSVWDLTVVLYPELRDPHTAAYPDLIRRAVGEGAFVHVASRFVAEQVIAEFSIDPDRVRTVPPGVPRLGPPGGCAQPVRLDLPEGCHRYVLAIGTVEPRKDYPLLVSAFTAATAAHPDVALVIAGKDGWGSERFSAAVEASPARSRVVRAGYLDDGSLGAVLAGASVLAFPSLYEGFGFPPLQAMAAGVPVVATAAGSVPEVVGDGALLVAPGDADGLAAALDRVLAGGSEVEDVVARGSRRAARFSWSACAEGLVGLYADAVADRPAGHRRPGHRRPDHRPVTAGRDAPRRAP